MLFQTVVFLTFTVICVSSLSDQRCVKQYTRVKRGRFYSYPQKFYNLPPFAIPVSGAYSNTPPPAISYESNFSGSRPYKVSKRPTSPINDGLGDEDVINLVKHLSKQDLNKIVDYAQEKDQGYNKYKEIYNSKEYTRPYKRESKILYKGNKIYEEPTHYKQSNSVNYVTESNYANGFSAQETSNPVWINSDSRYELNPFNTDSFAPVEKFPNDDENPAQNYINAQIPVSFGSNTKFQYVHTAQESQKPHMQYDAEYNPAINTYNSEGLFSFPTTNNPYFTESVEEANLPRPVNIREEDFEVSYTNNVPKVVQAETSFHGIENFGDLPLMDYTQFKSGDVSSYHVPHYTVTQPKPPKTAPPAPVSFSSPLLHSSSTSLLKVSPAAAAIKNPVYEPAPPKSAAVEQSDAHLKAIKIWSHKSKGAAYTLHDDGTLTPERNI